MKYLEFPRIDPKPLSMSEVIRPFSMGSKMTVLLPVASHSMIFNLSAAMLTVEIPQLFGTRFELGPEKIGLQFLGIIVGTILGEMFNAVVLKLMNRRTVENQRRAVNPNNYLFASYLGFVCMIVGLVVFCVLLGNTTPGHYEVSPIIGIGVAGFGNQLVSNFLINCKFWLDYHFAIGKTDITHCRYHETSRRERSHCFHLFGLHSADVVLHRAFLVPCHV